MLTNNLALDIQFYGHVDATLTDFSELLQAYSEEKISIKDKKVFFSEWEKELGIIVSVGGAFNA
ncbi:hypothetical protein DX130_11905 [Paenibacillus paeoniae]|uniref:Uncharacterized protein n=1 Tax=Paenibacillus paeoniae TaxID=2292705 RepID=A0A371PNG0_9BACL|nr:hypothetical protein DX130_11905 [Paenibacillus paeoniae]